MPELLTGPSAAELVVSVREFLESLRDEVPAERVFHLLVAANALGIIERELADGGVAEDAHAERLARLGYADDAALARAIRHRVLGTDELADVTAAVRADVEARLRVNSPTYADPR